MNGVELFFLIFCTTSNSLGILFNITLLYVVTFKTPRHLKVYAILLGNIAITDFFACLASLIVQQRLVPVRTSVVYFSYGPSRFIGAEFCYLTYAFVLSCYTHSLYCLLFSFYFRYYILTRSQPRGNKVKLIIALISAPSLFQFGILIKANQPEDRLIPVLKGELPQYNIVGETISGHANVFEWRLLTAILHMTLPITPVYVGILILRKRIIAILSKDKMSEHTKKIHSELLKAITYQAFLPALFFLGVLSYTAGQVGLCHHPLLEHLTSYCFLVLPTLSPLMSLRFIAPYKKYLMSLLSGNLKKTHLGTKSVTKGQPRSHITVIDG